MLSVQVITLEKLRLPIERRLGLGETARLALSHRSIQPFRQRSRDFTELPYADLAHRFVKLRFQVSGT